MKIQLEDIIRDIIKEEVRPWIAIANKVPCPSHVPNIKCHYSLGQADGRYGRDLKNEATYNMSNL
jgi:hypothetical protein